MIHNHYTEFCFVYNWPPNQKFDFDLWQHCTIPIVILTMLTKGQVMDFLSCSQEGLTVMKVEFHSWFWQPWEQASVSKVWSSGSFSFLQHLSHCVGGQCAVLMGPMPSNFSNYLRRGTFVMAVIVINGVFNCLCIVVETERGHRRQIWHLLCSNQMLF